MLYRDLLVSKLMSEMHTRIFLEVWMRLIVNKCLAEESGGDLTSQDLMLK